jgi:hypothetical protein
MRSCWVGGNTLKVEAPGALCALVGLGEGSSRRGKEDAGSPDLQVAHGHVEVARQVRGLHLVLAPESTLLNVQQGLLVFSDRLVIVAGLESVVPYGLDGISDCVEVSVGGAVGGKIWVGVRGVEERIVESIV